MVFDDREMAVGLDAYVDGVVRRRPPAAPDLDPALAETVRRFHALGAATAPRPDPSFVARLEADLMADSTSTASIFGTPIGNGHAPAVRLGPGARPKSERRGWPITALLVAAVVLLTVAVGLAANRGGPGGRDPEGRGLGAVQPAPATPESWPTETVRASIVDGACDLEPRAAGAPLGRLGTPTASLSFPPEVAFDSLSGISTVPESFLPTGPPAGSAIAAGIRSTLVSFAACSQAGDADRRFAAFTDDYFRRPSTWPEGASLRLPPLPTTVRAALNMIVVGPRLLPDGRVGVVVTPPAGPLLFLVVVERDGRWLIDEYVPIEVGSSEGTPTSVSAASPAPAGATAAWVGFASTHRVRNSATVNVRPGPSFDNPPLVALPPGTPLQYLDEDAPTADPERDGPRWMRFRTEDGLEGWVREIDLEPFRDDGSDPTPTVEAPILTPTPTLSAQAEPVLDPETDEALALDPTTRTETIRTDPDAVLAGDPVVLDDLRAQLRDALAEYGPDCRAGFVLVSANGELGEGNELARAVLDLLRQGFPDLFGDAAGEVFAQPGVEPLGEVTLQIFFFQGCQPAAP